MNTKNNVEPAKVRRACQVILHSVYLRYSVAYIFRYAQTDILMYSVACLSLDIIIFCMFISINCGIIEPCLRHI